MLRRQGGRGAFAILGAHRVRGLTLVEMLVVIAIIAILMGIGVGVLTTLRNRSAYKAQVAAVRAVVRHARNAARAGGRGARVTIGRDGVRAIAWETLGRWHLEPDDVTPLTGTPSPGGSPGGSPPPSPGGRGDPGGTGSPPPSPGGSGGSAATRGNVAPVPVATVRGAYDQDGEARGEVTFAPGQIGQGMELILSGHLEVPHRPRLGPTLGVAVEVWVQPYDLSYFRQDGADLERAPPTPEDGSTPDEDDPYVFYIIRKGDAFWLRVTESYAVQAGVGGTAAPTAAAGAQAGSVTGGSRRTVEAAVTTVPYVLQPYQWARIRMAFDGERIGLWINGIERPVSWFDPAGAMEITEGAERWQYLRFPDELPERLAVDPTAPLRIGDPDRNLSWFGLVDEIEVQGVLGVAEQPIPPELSIWASTEDIFFDAAGRLDPLVHTEPVEIVLWPTPPRSEAPIATPSPGGSPIGAPPPSPGGRGDPEAQPVFPTPPAGGENDPLVTRIRIDLSGTVE